MHFWQQTADSDSSSEEGLTAVEDLAAQKTVLGLLHKDMLARDQSRREIKSREAKIAAMERATAAASAMQRAMDEERKAVAKEMQVVRERLRVLDAPDRPEHTGEEARIRALEATVKAV